MSWEAFNGLDYFFLGVFIVSGLFGILRGFIREMVSIATWVTAFILASLFSGKLATVFSGVTAKVGAQLARVTTGTGVNPEAAAGALSVGLSFIVIFVVVMIVGALVGRFLSTVAYVPGIGLANRLFGAAFGVFRGFLGNLIMMFIVQLTPFSQQSLWLESQMVRAYQPCLHWLSKNLDRGFSEVKDRTMNIFHQKVAHPDPA